VENLCRKKGILVYSYFLQLNSISRILNDFFYNYKLMVVVLTGIIINTISLFRFKNNSFIKILKNKKF